MLSIRLIKFCFIALTLNFLTLNVLAQSFKFSNKFTRHDTLRGSLGPGRTWWDVLKYDIWFTPNRADSTISGCNYITYKVVGPQNFMQIDLQKPLLVDSAAFIDSKGKRSQVHLITAKRDSNCLYFRELPKQELNSINTFIVYYHGRPRIARFPPWDGGLIWKADKKGNPWISIACQGLGASVWYPCKDHQSDEPDSAGLHITCANDLVGVGNGRLRSKTINSNGTTTWNWAVVSPINSYCIIPYIGKYTHFGEVYQGESGPLDMDYWVLEENLDSAKKHFTDAPKMMKAFEHWFGPYPFYKDSYKLVDAPHLGMEHQSATAYGNGYLKGYYGRDLSGTGWGLKWDFIIVHESGHEWFANNITTKDIADMWVHEGFTNYSETLFTDYFYGKQAGNEYCQGIRKGIMNDKPIIGLYGVNQEGSGDMYPKAANMIHMIRQLVNDDEKFRMILRGLNRDFKWHAVTTAEIEDYINKQAGQDFSKIFDQYLRNTKPPTLKYGFKNGTFTYQWTNCVEGFNMPILVNLEIGRGNPPWRADQFPILLTPTTKPQKLKGRFKESIFAINPNFYIFTEKMK